MREPSGIIIVTLRKTPGIKNEESCEVVQNFRTGNVAGGLLPVKGKLTTDEVDGERNPHKLQLPSSNLQIVDGKRVKIDASIAGKTTIWLELSLTAPSG